jgi:hypothetical protein
MRRGFPDDNLNLLFFFFFVASTPISSSKNEVHRKVVENAIVEYRVP